MKTRERERECARWINFNFGTCHYVCEEQIYKHCLAGPDAGLEEKKKSQEFTNNSTVRVEDYYSKNYFRN